MKKLILSQIFIIAFLSISQSQAASNCGSTTVMWPEGTSDCAAQLVYNSGAKVGATEAVIDPANNSTAQFQCTKAGWKFISGDCSATKKSTCGSSTLTWSEANSGECAAQLIANGGAPINMVQVAMDPVNIGSSAHFKCTKNGWEKVSGSCNAERPVSAKDTKSNKQKVKTGSGVN